MDVAAANVLLDSWLGGSKAAGVPASFDLALFDGHPDTGAEITGGGYARPTVANDAATWPAATAGEKTSAVVDLIGTGPYDVAATHWRLYAAGVAYFTGELDTPVNEPTDTVELAVFFGDES